MSLPALLFIFLTKLALFPAYTSTDFEVHRNWLSITKKLPIQEWYTWNDNEWTLDYPPLFAWWQKALGFCIPNDWNLVKLSSTPVLSWNIVVFQRLSVFIGDLFLWFAVKKYFAKDGKSSDQKLILELLVFASPFFYIVDNIHFQYNSLLFAMLIFSLDALKRDQLVLGAFWYALLFNFKHIYFYIAPVYGIYYIKRIVQSRNVALLIKTGLVVAGTTIVTYAPWIRLRQIPQVLSRLFPFKRGLTHAYWAPNFWALYNTLDRFLSTLFPSHSTANTGTKGLVQDIIHIHLPQISPTTTLVLTLLAMIPPLYLTWTYRDNYRGFLIGLIGCGWASYLFGWHVHEKAISMVLIPFLLLVSIPGIPREYHVLNFQIQLAGIISLFPLLYQWMETPLKLVVSFVYLELLHHLLPIANPKIPTKLTTYPLGKFLLKTYPLIYIATVPLNLFIPALISVWEGRLQKDLSFANLMWTSLWCSMGIVTGFIQFLYLAWLSR